mmetsp:Transcript_74980/g.214782  ORF Transcript_74980/g.214782 Transcript_74980/m.214782 type:complete len:239 (-) Transcript_74980:39-755(-)
MPTWKCPANIATCVSGPEPSAAARLPATRPKPRAMLPGPRCQGAAALCTATAAARRPMDGTAARAAAAAALPAAAGAHRNLLGHLDHAFVHPLQKEGRNLASNAKFAGSVLVLLLRRGRGLLQVGHLGDQAPGGVRQQVRDPRLRLFIEARPALQKCEHQGEGLILSNILSARLEQLADERIQGLARRLHTPLVDGRQVLGPEAVVARLGEELLRLERQHEVAHGRGDGRPTGKSATR